MVYESDFYTVRRPYSTRITPSVTSYSYTGVPSQYTKYFPSVGKVFVLNNFHPSTSYLPYIGHTNFVSSYGSGAIHPIHVIRVRPSVVMREFDRIEHKFRPALTYSPYDSYTKSAYIQKKNDGVLKNFEDEKRLIRRQTDALLKRVHQPVPRVTVRIMPTGSFQRYYDETPLRIKVMSDNYLSRMFSPIKQMADNIYNISYYSEPARKYIASILDPLRPSRIFSAPRQLPDPADERKEVEALKAAQKARLIESADVDTAAQIRQKKLEAKVAEEKALAEERARQKEQAKADEKAKAAEAARKKELEAQAEAQRQAEVEKQRKEEAEKEAQRIEKARKEEEARQASEAKKAAEEEAARKAAEEEAAKKAAEEEAARKAEEERKQLERLEEIARQAEEEKEKELKRQAEELAQLARQQAETAEEAPAETEAPADAEPASPPAEAEDTGAESVDEQAELPAEGDSETPAVEAEPVVDEPATPEVNDAAAAEEEEEEEEEE